MSAYVIGVDPGLTTGVFAVEWFTGNTPGLRSDPVAVQVHGSEGVIPFVQTMVAHRPGTDIILAVEQFVVGGRAGRSATPHAGRIARALITELQTLALHLVDDRDCSLFTRTAALVKPWATDKRLDAAGLLDATKGMGHARDAARHALYAAVHMGLTADPLSKAAVR